MTDTTKKLTRTAALLALLLVIQCFKNFSVYLSGPLVNAVLIIATVSSGLYSGIFLSIVAPITSFFITQSPIISGTNFTMLPVIMIGNLIIILAAYFTEKKGIKAFSVGLVAGSVLKWLAMWAMVDLIIKPMFSAGMPAPQIAMLGKMFTHVQLYAGLLGSLIAVLVWIKLSKILNKKQG